MVAGAVEAPGDLPEVLVAKGPLEGVEPGEIERDRVIAQRLLALQVEVVLEVARGELADVTKDGLAVAQPREIGLGDGTPAPPLPEDRQHVVVVADRLQVDQQRTVADAAQRRGREERAVVAVGPALGQDAARRAGVVLGAVVERVDEGLDAARGPQRAQDGELGARPAGRRGPGKGSSGHGRGVYCTAWATTDSARSISRRIRRSSRRTLRA